MQYKKTIQNMGYVYAIVSAILFGASTPAAKYLLGRVDPWLLAGLLYLGSGLGLIFILVINYFILKKPTQEASLTIHDYGWLALVTIFGGIIGPLLLMFGLVHIQASTVSLLLNLESVLTATMAWIIFKEHTDKRLVVGMLFIVIGGLVIAWQGQLKITNILGPLLVAGACLAWAIDNNLTRKISAADPLKIVAIKSFVAGITNVTLALWFGATLAIQWNIIFISSLIGFIGYGVSIICFILGLRNIGTARTGAYFSLAPFIGAAFSICFLGETLSIQLIIAGILMGVGLWLHLTESHEHEHDHELLKHEHKHYHDEHHKHEHLPTDPSGEPHSHRHVHEPMRHSHMHYPDIHHRHGHKKK